MAITFAEKFEQVLEDRKAADPAFGLRTVARILAKDDREKVETIRRRLNKYRPPKGGGAAETKPTEPTRREIEDALGLDPDSLKADPIEPADAMIAALARDLSRFIDQRVDHRMRTAVGA